MDMVLLTTAPLQLTCGLIILAWLMTADTYY
jgi:hypothetical protein